MSPRRVGHHATAYQGGRRTSLHLAPQAGPWRYRVSSRTNGRGAGSWNDHPEGECRADSHGGGRGLPAWGTGSGCPSTVRSEIPDAGRWTVPWCPRHNQADTSIRGLAEPARAAMAFLRVRKIDRPMSEKPARPGRSKRDITLYWVESNLALAERTAPAEDGAGSSSGTRGSTPRELAERAASPKWSRPMIGATARFWRRHACAPTVAARAPSERAAHPGPLTELITAQPPSLRSSRTKAVALAGSTRARPRQMTSGTKRPSSRALDRFRDLRSNSRPTAACQLRRVPAVRMWRSH